VFCKLVEMNITHRFDTVIIHCGTNYIPHKSSHYIKREIIDMLKSIQLLMPSTYIIFSALLPRTTPAYLKGITNINRWMSEECLDLGIGYMAHGMFGKSFNVDRRLLCGDGVHLSFDGVFELQRSMFFFMK
jgi:hypothetical protein